MNRPGEINMHLTNAYPRANWSTTRRMDAYTMLGTGRSDAEIHTDDIRTATPIGMRMIAAGLYNALITSRLLDLAIKINALILRQESGP